MIPSKLRSRRGASLIVALFFLIICSTVGSIILTAATANVGRISERAAYDKKYYKVISAARLFADELAKISEDGITLNVTPLGVSAPPDIRNVPVLQDAESKLSVFIQNDLYDIYTGRKDSDAIAARYWANNFSNIGSEEDYKASKRTSFTIEMDGQSKVYGRFMVEASRMGVIDAELDPGLENVAHNVTAVFYSDEDTENPNQIPDNAYVVKLICPADTVYPAFSDDGEAMSIEFKWTRDNMKIEQVQGVG